MRRASGRKPEEVVAAYDLLVYNDDQATSVVEKFRKALSEHQLEVRLTPSKNGLYQEIKIESRGESDWC